MPVILKLMAIKFAYKFLCFSFQNQRPVGRWIENKNQHIGIHFAQIEFIFNFNIAFC